MNDRHGPGGSDDRLMQAARALPREIAPERDLWPDIAARIGAEETPPAGRDRWRLVAAVAAAVALVAVSSLMTLWLVDEPAPVVVRQGPPAGGLALPARSVPLEASFGAGYTLGPRYERARNELTRDLDRQLAALPEDTRALVNRNLAQIREALAEINDELAENPNNVLLQQLLLAAYQDELAVLMNVNRMAQTLPTRTEI
jgi:hypothetical protein